MTGMPRRPGRTTTLEGIRHAKNLTPQGKQLYSVVPVRNLKNGMRLLLEMEAPDVPDITRRFLDHIDKVRHALLMGEVSPDDAHAMLLDCRWAVRK